MGRERSGGGSDDAGRRAAELERRFGSAEKPLSDFEQRAAALGASGPTRQAVDALAADVEGFSRRTQEIQSRIEERERSLHELAAEWEKLGPKIEEATRQVEGLSAAKSETSGRLNGSAANATRSQTWSRRSTMSRSAPSNRSAAN